MRLNRGQSLIVATHNAGKLREISDLLAPFGVTALSAGQLGLPEPAETETTFAGNARIKAHSAATAGNLPALSDDSGLSVEVLDGEPGVYSADWAETPNGRDFDLAMEKVRLAVEAKQAIQPVRAYFTCMLCLAWPGGNDLLFEGRVSGSLHWPGRGTNGFGYDPIFIADGRTQTFGEMDPQEKHRLSHRADAFRQFTEHCLGGADDG